MWLRRGWLLSGTAAVAIAAVSAISVTRADDAPPAQAASGELVARGKYLATMGDCVACHSTPGGAPFAGGLYVNTPFGAIASSNITPDRETGIGAWSDDDFYRAMHTGVGRDGGNLYPVFPFNSYTKVTREDVQAIKAYLFTLQPVHAPQQPNKLSFPMNVRLTLNGWRALYFHEGTFQPDPNRSEEINRGAYLVEGLGHCGECHTPRTALGGPEARRALAGGAVDGWYAPNISSDVQEGLGAWSIEDVVSYLKTGTAPGKGVMVGPMSQVVHESLSKISDADLHAIAAYLKSAPAQQDGSDRPAPGRTASAVGAEVYLGYCAGCHQTSGQGIEGRIPPLAGNGAVTSTGPETILSVVLGGLSAQGNYGPMPGFLGTLTNEQIADVANYIRSTWGNGAPDNATANKVDDLIHSVHVPFVGTGDNCPTVEQGSLAAKLSDPNAGVTAMLRDVTDAKVYDQIDAIITKARAVQPGVGVADMTNAVTAAYCPVVASTDGLTQNQKRWRLNRFSQLLWGKLASQSDRASR